MISDVLGLNEQVAVVTGAGSGIGRATAMVLADAGASVVCVDIDLAAAEATSSDVARAGGRAMARQVDVTDPDQVRTAMTEAHEWQGHLDILVNAAGAVTARGPVASLTDEDLETSIALNLKSLIYGCRSAAACMRRDGSIINVGSGTVDGAVADLAAYSIPKAGVLQLTRSLARELAPAGIRVNAISPGFILTRMTQARWQDHDDEVRPQMRDQVLAEQSAQIPLGRPGQANEVATVALFLAGQGSSYVTGQVIRVNGGSVMPL